MAKTNQELLDEVTQAISDVLSKGQSYAIDTGSGARTYTRANLQSLMSIKSQLEKDVAREAAGGVKVQYGVPQ